ncbi:MAG: VWA domain-containing protein [Deltaproteobacteria bacterium]|nr:VWA domain-containing protein [Deltaproteobacteria bacterium]
MNGDTLTFGNPLYAWGLVPAMLLVVWAAVQTARWLTQLRKLGTGKVVPTLVESFSVQRQATRIFLWGFALILLVVAAMRPHYGVRETEVSNAGIDVALVVDASKSMLVKDIVPNRLQGTVLEINALLGRLAGGRVALVPFAGIPFVQCPLTSDRDVVRTYLADLKPEDIPVGGTNIGRALTMATDLLTGEREHAEAELRDNLMLQFKGSKNKAIVLFSDGEDHEGAALDAARKAAEKGVKVYTVGVGSAFGDPVPLLGPDGTVTGILKDENGQPVFSKLNLDLLQQIAQATGAKAFHYSNQSIVPELFPALDALEKAEYQSQFKQLGEDRFQWLLGPALLLLLAELALAPRRRQLVAKLLLALLFAGTVARPQVAQAAWIERENPDIRNGRSLVDEKKYGDALQSFKQAQATRPEHAMIWYDIGIAQAWLGQHAEAVTALSRALGALPQRDAKLEADIHYALGTTQLEWARKLEKEQASNKPAPDKDKEPKDDKAQDKPPEPPPPSGTPGTDGPLPHFKLAVQSLEQALLADPTRTDVRRNLELARLGAYPPCASRDKEQEPNDAPEQAKLLTLPEGQRETTINLRMCPGDRDLFKLGVEPGDRVTAKVLAKPEPAGATEDSTAVPGQPELGLAVLSLDGKQLLAGTVPDQKAVQDVTMTSAAGQQTVLVDVRDRGEIETPYDLTVKILPACPRIEDSAEPNDTPAQARAIAAGQPIQARLCPGNADYFKVGLLPGQGLRVAAKPKYDLGAQQLNLDIVNGGDGVLAHGVSAKEGVATRIVGTPGGDVLIRVVGGVDTEADYELQVEVLPPCGERDDAFEDNDQALSANPLPAEMLSKPLENLQLCPNDDDWYAADLKQGESLFVDLSANLEGMPDAADLAGQLTVEVYDEKGNVWGQGVGSAVAQGGSLVRTVVVLEPPAGRYRVRVTGGGVEVPRFPAGGIQNLPAAPIGPPAGAPSPDPSGNPGRSPDPSLNPDPNRGPSPDPNPNRGPNPSPNPDPNRSRSPNPNPNPSRLPTPPPGPTQPVPPQLGLPQGAGQPQGLPPGMQLGAPQGAGGQPGQPGQPPIPQPIPHISLPPGTPTPGVDRQHPQLDLPYTLRLRILPPCPEGNDEQEPNNAAKDAKPIEVGSEHLLRICKGDTDWLQLSQKAGQNLQVTARYDRSHGAIDLAAWDESGVKELAHAQTATGNDKAGKDLPDTPAARRSRTTMQGLMIPAGKADRVVKLKAFSPGGTENFYVLRVEEPPPPSDKDKQQQDQQDQDKKDEQDEKDKQDQKKDEKKPEEQQKQEDQERLKRQMERNDHNPSNLEAQEALRNSPFKNQRPDKDW